MKTSLECLAVQGFSLKHVLQSCNYSNLCKFTLVNFNLIMASHIFKGMLFVISNLKNVEIFFEFII